MRKIAGCDFDFEDSKPMNVMDGITSMIPFMVKAESIELTLIGPLETKKAQRVRLKIIYNEES